MTPYELYLKACRDKSDINQLLPHLKLYAKMCKHVTELGTRYGTSAIAFCSGGAQVISYDISRFPFINHVEDAFPKFEARLGNSLLIEIEETDLLFVDTIHTYAQVQAELNLHHNRVKKWILLHDTVTFGRIGDDGGVGISKAIEEFLERYSSEWKFKEQYVYNNGLVVLERITHKPSN
jgi:cephalosporin hydroxylase